jgi:predicted AAA+ superfamily ATPase
VDVDQLNHALAAGVIDRPGLFPRLDELARAPFVFRVDFGLGELPLEPGVLLVRGARLYGKSTWLEGELRQTVEAFGPGSAYYLNGDEIPDAERLAAGIRALLPTFRPDAGVRRLFIDEITAVDGWVTALKRVLDRGELRDVLVVTTGSRATDLRRGAERLPGRKGRLARTTFVFTPLPFAEFERVTGAVLGADTLLAYLLSGGCPIAGAELAAHGVLPEFVPVMVRDWMLGECAATGRDRGSLLAVLEVLLTRGGVPLGQSLVARAAGLANNTVANGYLELLADLHCIGVGHAWDADRRGVIRRKRAKYPLINLLAAVAWHRARLRSPADFRALPPEQQGMFHEWLVAQELWRRAAIRGDELPDVLPYWEGGEHELDFVVGRDEFVEVKRGRTSAVEFGWFARALPGRRLTVVGRDRFEAERMRGVTIEDFLRGAAR